MAYDVAKSFTRKEKMVIGHRENRALQLIIQGFNSSEIAVKLNIRRNIIDTYRKSLLLKLNPRNPPRPDTS